MYSYVLAMIFKISMDIIIVTFIISHYFFSEAEQLLNNVLLKDALCAITQEHRACSYAEADKLCSCTEDRSMF